MLFISLLVGLIAVANSNLIDNSLAESKTWIITCKACVDIMNECLTCVGEHNFKLKPTL